MTENIEMIIKRCSVCKRININNVWYEQGLITFTNVKPLYTDGICNYECAMKGYGLTEFEAKEVLGYDKIKKEVNE